MLNRLFFLQSQVDKDESTSWSTSRSNRVGNDGTHVACTKYHGTHTQAQQVQGMHRMLSNAGILKANISFMLELRKFDASRPKIGAGRVAVAYGT